MMTSGRMILLVGLATALFGPAVRAQHTSGAPQASELWGGPAARGQGNAGARFDTTITISAGSAAATGSVDYWAGGSVKASVPFSLPPLGVATIATPDALDGAGAFLYHLTASSAVTAFSETYNDTANGRFGLSIPAFLSTDFLNAGDQAAGGGAEDSSDPTRSRTNVGVLCSPNSSLDCQVQVAAYDSSGSLLGIGTLTAAHGSAGQASLTGVVPGASGFQGIYLQMRVLQGVAQPYAIRNDNRTSDGTQIPLSVNRGVFSTAPVITAFNVTPQTGCAPLTTTISWTTTGASKVSFPGVTGDLPPSGSTTVNLATSTDLVLTATAPSGAVSTQTRRVTILPAAATPTPSPSEAQVATGGTINGLIPPEPPGTVTYTFTQQGSAGSTFTLIGSNWTYVAGSTAGTDVVHLTAAGVCGDVSADLTITVLAPGAPAITSFTANPRIGCSPQNVSFSWTTQDTESVMLTGVPFPLAPNGFWGMTLTGVGNVVVTLTARGLNGKSTSKTINVQLDQALPVPILTPGSVILAPGMTQEVILTGVPASRLNTVTIAKQQYQTGGTFLATGIGTYLYTAGPIRGTDIFRVYDVNGCGANYATFTAVVQ